jgi:hypothetical protein
MSRALFRFFLHWLLIATFWAADIVVVEQNIPSVGTFGVFWIARYIMTAGVCVSYMLQFPFILFGQRWFPWLDNFRASGNSLLNVCSLLII